jgi:hypothetical protein
VVGSVLVFHGSLNLIFLLNKFYSSLFSTTCALFLTSDQNLKYVICMEISDIDLFAIICSYRDFICAAYFFMAIKTFAASVNSLYGKCFVLQ